MTLREDLKAYLDNMPKEDLIDLWNQYCSEADCYDCAIFYMDNFDDDFCDCTPTEIARKMEYAVDFSLADDYYWYDNNGNLTSSNNPVTAPRSPITTADIAWSIAHTGDAMGNKALKAIYDAHKDRMALLALTRKEA